MEGNINNNNNFFGNNSVNQPNINPMNYFYNNNMINSTMMMNYLNNNNMTQMYNNNNQINMNNGNNQINQNPNMNFQTMYMFNNMMLMNSMLNSMNNMNNTNFMNNLNNMNNFNNNNMLQQNMPGNNNIFQNNNTINENNGRKDGKKFHEYKSIIPRVESHIVIENDFPIVPRDQLQTIVFKASTGLKTSITIPRNKTIKDAFILYARKIGIEINTLEKGVIFIHSAGKIKVNDRTLISDRFHNWNPVFITVIDQNNLIGG